MQLRLLGLLACNSSLALPAHTPPCRERAIDIGGQGSIEHMRSKALEIQGDHPTSHQRLDKTRHCLQSQRVLERPPFLLMIPRILEMGC